VPPSDRVAALSLQLARTHDELLEQVAQVRAALVAGHAPGPLDRGLLAHCTAFCVALDRHHSAEDDGLLPLLAREEPGLAPAVRNLLQDHAMIGTLLGQVVGLVQRAAAGEGTDRLVGELDGLAAVMESHFSYEERAIGAAIDRLGPGAWTDGVIGT
jgi:hypothetical protein